MIDFAVIGAGGQIDDLLEENDSYTLAEIGSAVTFSGTITSGGPAASVVLEVLSGTTVIDQGIENVTPYDVTWNLGLGEGDFTLRATSHAATGGNGAVLGVQEIDFSVTGGSTGVSGTLTASIAIGSDDTDQNANGNVNLGKSDIELGDGGRDVGLRFQDVDLASLQGVDITDAYLQFTTRANGGNVGALSATIAIEDSVSAATFSGANSPLDRDQFDFVQWTDTDVPGAGEEFRSVNFAGMLEAFVAEWDGSLETDNDIAFVIEDDNGVRRFESFEGGDAPVLVIEYNDPGLV